MAKKGNRNIYGTTGSSGKTAKLKKGYKPTTFSYTYDLPSKPAKGKGPKLAPTPQSSRGTGSKTPKIPRFK